MRGLNPDHYTRTALFSAVLAGMLTVACADLGDDTRLAEPSVREALPSQEFEHVTMTHTEEGEVQFILRTPHLEQYEKRKKAIMYGGVEVEFYEDGQISSRLTSDRGEVSNNGKNLKAIGNVVVITDSGTTILTPRLNWSRALGEITSDTIVTIITEWDTLYGTGLVANEDLSERRILQPTGVSMRTVSEGGGGGGISLSSLYDDSGEESSEADTTDSTRAAVSIDTTLTDSITTSASEPTDTLTPDSSAIGELSDSLSSSEEEVAQ